jgi:hypothetical protein
MAKGKAAEKPQAQRFLEAAEKAGVDKSGRKFAAAMKKVAQPKTGKPTKKG